MTTRIVLTITDAARPRPVGLKHELEAAPLLGRLERLLACARRLGFAAELQGARLARQPTLRPKQAGR
jgi:hypothetical protein